MTDYLNVLIYIFLAILPGIVWFIYFLRKDKRPEPKFVILRTFILGALMTLPVFGVEKELMSILDKFELSQAVYWAIKYFFVIAITEEAFKYLAFRFSAFRSPYMDEAIDMPMYMIIAALGFSVAENIVLFLNMNFETMTDPIILSFLRLIGGTLLHALAAGVFGVFLAIAYYNIEERIRYILSGFIIAVMVHGIFDFFLKYSIIETGGKQEITCAIAVIGATMIICFILLRQSLKKLNKLKSICVYEKRKNTKY